jgi:hypothetical protein
VIIEPKHQEFPPIIVILIKERERENIMNFDRRMIMRLRISSTKGIPLEPI